MKINLSHAEVRALTTVRAYPNGDLFTGHVDSKGRKIGAISYRADSVTTDGVMVYSAAVDNARDGKPHGAGADFQRFTTAEARDTYIEKRFDSILAKYPAI